MISVATTNRVRFRPYLNLPLENFGFELFTKTCVSTESMYYCRIGIEFIPCRTFALGRMTSRPWVHDILYYRHAKPSGDSRLHNPGSLKAVYISSSRLCSETEVEIILEETASLGGSWGRLPSTIFVLDIIRSLFRKLLSATNLERLTFCRSRTRRHFQFTIFEPFCD